MEKLIQICKKGCIGCMQDFRYVDDFCLNDIDEKLKIYPEFFIHSICPYTTIMTASFVLRNNLIKGQ